MSHGTRSIRELQDIARGHHIWRHGFLQRCRAGQLTPQEVGILSVQMYSFTRSFCRILATILAACPEEEVQIAIGENMFEELGEGDPQRTHPALFRRFTRAIGISDEALAWATPEPETRAMIDTYLRMAHRHGSVAALAAVCFASEGIVATLYSQLEKGIEGVTRLPREALIFFDLHVHIDSGHAARLQHLLAPRMHGDHEIGAARVAVLEALEARCAFFDGIERRAGQGRLLREEASPRRLSVPPRATLPPRSMSVPPPC